MGRRSPPSGKTQSVLGGPSWLYRRYIPSGETSSRKMRLWVSKTSSSDPDPLAGLMARLNLYGEPRYQANAILLPSGQKCGPYSQPGSAVSRRRGPRSRSFTQRSPNPFGSVSSSQTTRRLSGERSYLPYESGSAMVSSSFPVRLNQANLLRASGSCPYNKADGTASST